jgi:hypothetical protein
VTPYRSGRCSVCGCDVALTKAGNLVGHWARYDDVLKRRVRANVTSGFKCSGRRPLVEATS